MKFASAATLILAGVAQAAVANQAGNQDMNAMDANAMTSYDQNGMAILSAMYGQTPAGSQISADDYGKGGGGGGSRLNLGDLFKKLACGLPCIESAVRKIKCKGNPLDAACDGIDQIKKDSEKCLYKCGIDKTLVELGQKAAHYICDKRSEPSKKGGYGGKDKKKY